MPQFGPPRSRARRWAGRLAGLTAASLIVGLAGPAVPAQAADITDGLEEAEESDLERRKSRWAALAAAAGAKGRVEQLAADLLAHFTDRTATLDGKAMAVCSTIRPEQCLLAGGRGVTCHLYDGDA